jgi:hypothetical protein
MNAFTLPQEITDIIIEKNHVFLRLSNFFVKSYFLKKVLNCLFKKKGVNFFTIVS